MGSTHATGPGEQWFTTTHWSLILRAGSADTAPALKALEQLCAAYWYPLYAYIRRRGHTEHDAQDLTQGFFERLLQREGLRGVMPGRGKFRSFLLVCLNNFLVDEHVRKQAQKRGGGQAIISFDAAEAEQRYQLEPRHSETPEKLFERKWALALLDRALAQLEHEFSTASKAALLERLRGFIIEDAPDQTYAEIGAAIGMSEEAVKKATQRMRRRYQEILREQIGHTVATSSEIEEELRYLSSVLSE